jgi:hypothetical protein
MIRNETECQEASKRLGDELKRLDEHGVRLKETVPPRSWTRSASRRFRGNGNSSRFFIYSVIY